MSEVIKKAQELAKLISESEEYNAMRTVEEDAIDDEAMNDKIAEYQAKREEIEAASMEETPDFEKIGALSRELEVLKDEFNSMPKTVAMQSARQAFAEMMSAVNYELQKVLQPEAEAGGCSSCGSGGCGSCGGCGH